jgi:CheY-like chemotaxis protein
VVAPVVAASVDAVAEAGSAEPAAPIFGSVRARAAVAVLGDADAPIAPKPRTARRMRVLMAEDNKTNQLVFSKLIKSRDIDLVVAGNGHEAVAAFEAGPLPDLIFMDISMPGMDGKEATGRIRKIEAERGLPATRIVALTAHAMAGDGEEIMAHGLDAYLTKPFDKAAILAEIDTACPAEAQPAIMDAS